LLELSAKKQDRVLEHSIIYALIELNDPKATAAGLNAFSPFEARAALIALDQMDEGGLKPDMVTPWLTSHDPARRETALWVVGHHPEWGDAMVPFFRRCLNKSSLADAAARELQHQLEIFSGNDSIQKLLGEQLTNTTTPPTTIQVILRVMAGAAPKSVPSE